MKFKQLFSVFVILSLLVSCATSPTKITASYVSPLLYKDYDDDQIIMEMDHVGRRSLELYNSLKKEANNDTAQMTVGLLVFLASFILSRRWRWARSRRICTS